MRWFYAFPGVGGPRSRPAAVFVSAATGAGLDLLLGTALAGGLLAAVMVLSSRAGGETARNFARLAGHWRRRGLTPCPAVALGRTRGVVVPYGVAIACGMLFTLASQWGGA